MKRKLLISKPQRIILSIFLYVVFNLGLVNAQSVFQATGGTNVSLDNSSAGITPAWTTLSGPVVTENAPGQLVVSDYYLFLPTDWQFDVSHAISIAVSGGDATFALSASSYIPGARTLIFHVSSVSTTMPVTLTFNNVRVQPKGTTTSTGQLSCTISNGTNFGSLSTIPGAARALLLSAASSSLSAGGNTQLTLKITDQFQNVITTFTGSKNITFSGLNTAPNGTSIPTVSNSTSTNINLGSATTIHFSSGISDIGGNLTVYKAEGPVTLAATDGTLTTSATGGTGASLTISPGAVDYSITTVSATPSIISPGSRAAVTLQAKDSYSNNLTAYGQTVAFSLGAGTSTGTFGTVTDNRNGSYTSLFTGATAGTATTITATYNGSGITSTLPTIMVATAGAASAYRITANSSTQTAGATNQLRITLVDANTLPITSFTGTKNLIFSGLATAPNGTTKPSVTNDSGTNIPLGTATEIHFTAGVSDAGGILTAYKAEGPVILNTSDSTLTTLTPGGLGATLTISPANVSYSETQVSVTPNIINPGSTANVTLQARDIFDNNLASGGAAVVFSLSGGTSAGTFATPTDNGNGSYTSVFTGVTAGTAATIHATYNNNNITYSTLPTITVAPFTISPTTSTVTVSSPTVVAGSSVTITLQAKTAAGVNITSGGGVIAFTFSGGTSTGVISAVTDHGDGTYTATFLGNTAGTPTTINATVAGVAVTTTLPTITVTYAAAAILKAVPAASSMITGASNDITITAYDLYGNVSQSYSGAKTITFTGLQGAETIGGSATSLSVNFTNGVSAAGALTFQALVARNAYLNFSDGLIGTSGDISYAAHINITVAIPAAPVALVATSITSSSFIANWSLSSGATTYFLDVALDQAFSTPVSGYINVSVGNVLFVQVSGLTGNTTYYYRVRAGNSNGTSTNSNVISTTTLLAIPNAPVANAASSINSNDFTANWTASQYASGYFLDVATDNAFTLPVSGYIGKLVGNVTFYKVTGVNPRTVYYYRVRAYNSQGESSNSNVITVTTLVGIEILNWGIPTAHQLFQNYPNPFNPSTKIQFSLPKDEMVRLSIYNILGEEVATLINQELPTGTYSMNFDASKLSNGIYIYRIQAGDFTQTKKMLLLK